MQKLPCMLVMLLLCTFNMMNIVDLPQLSLTNLFTQQSISTKGISQKKTPLKILWEYFLKILVSFGK